MIPVVPFVAHMRIRDKSRVMKGDIANPRLYDSTHDTKSHLNGILATTLPPEQEHPREPSSTYSHRYAQYLFVTGPRNMNDGYWPKDGTVIFTYLAVVRWCNALLLRGLIFMRWRVLLHYLLEQQWLPSDPDAATETFQEAKTMRALHSSTTESQKR